MREAFLDVLEFHAARRDPLPTDGPAAPTEGAVYFRCGLMAEEFKELNDAIAAGDVPEIADAIADSIYVLLGTAFAYGIDIVQVWDEVQQTNMAKTKDGPIFREDGKTMKPKDWRPPDIAGILARQRSLAEIYFKEVQMRQQKIETCPPRKPLPGQLDLPFEAKEREAPQESDAAPLESFVHLVQPWTEGWSVTVLDQEVS